MAQAAVRIRTSPGPGLASSTVSTVNGLPKARQTAARVFMGWIQREGASGREGSVACLGREFKRALVGRGHNFQGAGRMSPAFRRSTAPPEKGILQRAAEAGSGLSEEPESLVLEL